MKNLTACTDGELIRLFKAGQEQALDTLYLRYKDNTYNVILHYVRDTAGAEDLVQEVFIRIFSFLKSDRYCEEGKFLQWMLRIAYNISMDHLRKPKKEVCVENLAHTTAACEMVVSHEDVVIAQQKKTYLYHLISKLPREQKEVVYYRLVEELSFKEIAEKTGTNVNTTLGRMRYGLMHLRRGVEKHHLFVA